MAKHKNTRTDAPLTTVEMLNTKKRAGKVEARTVTVKDEWGHERVVGGFGDVGTPREKYPFDEPDSCANCGSEESMEFHQLSVDCKDGIPGWVCIECGHAHLEPSGPTYNDKLDPDIQISTEELIASTIANHATDDGYFGEEDCQRLGRDILKLVLGRFRPDLFDIKEIPSSK
jgi:hypothetical protein